MGDVPSQSTECLKFKILRRALFALTAGSLATAANAQSTCGDALFKLQNYVQQVNYAANYEYNQGIAMRCGGNWQCGNILLGQLQQWYMFQANSVNNWYMQLARQCSSERPSPIDRGDVDEGISEKDIEQLEVDDEDKTVALRIPDNPRGFRPRRQ